MNTNTEHFNHRLDSMAAHKVDLSFHRTQENKNSHIQWLKRTLNRGNIKDWWRFNFSIRWQSNQKAQTSWRYHATVHAYRPLYYIQTFRAVWLIWWIATTWRSCSSCRERWNGINCPLIRKNYWHIWGVRHFFCWPWRIWISVYAAT